MFDVNKIINDAIAAAVAQATAPLLERIAALELRSNIETKLLPLEDNPAQGVDAALHNRVRAAEAVATRLHERVLALEAHTSVLDEHGGLLEALDNQEWFWAKIRNFTDTAVEQAIENHTDCWDHDDFVREEKLDDYVKSDDIRDDIRDIISGATISIRI